MLLKQTKSASSIKFLSLSAWKSRRCVVTTALLVYSLLLIGIGVHLHRRAVQERLISGFRSNISHPWRRLSAMWTAKPETLRIEVSYRDFMQLAHQREKALQQTRFLAANRGYVKGVVEHDGRRHQVEMRLKGDGLDHLKDRKWSFRIVVKGDATIMGMKRFSLQHPLTRAYLNEWLYHQAMRREGIIGLRYDFVEVVVNGENWGVYAIEEHFEKRLIEHNERRDGPIVKFNESLVWHAVAQRESFGDRQALSLDDAAYFSADTDGFESERWLADPNTQRTYLAAIELLDCFRRGELSTSEVFDTDRLATFLALSDVLGAVHGARWHNLRFYFNPVSSRLEPIAFDGHAETPIVDISATRFNGSDPIQATDHYPGIFRDVAFTAKYISELERLGRAEYLDKLFEAIGDALDKRLTILHSEFPQYDFAREMFYENARFIHAVLHPPKALHAYLDPHSQSPYRLQMGSIQPLPVEVLALLLDDTVIEQFKDPILLKGKPRYDVVHFSSTFVTASAGEGPMDLPPGEFKVRHRLLGSQEIHETPIFPWPYTGGLDVKNDIARRSGNIDTFKFLVADPDGKVVIKPGSWALTCPLIVPRGHVLVAGPGTSLHLSDGAMIVSYSPIQFVGNPASPVIVTAADSGQGMVIIAAETESLLEHVVFEGLAAPQCGHWQLTGGVTFYESDVRLREVVFQRNRSEDAVTFIRSGVDMETCAFEDIHADAVDADFCRLRICDTSYIELGNDAVDVSGGVVHLEDIHVNVAQDKGISIGENAILTGSNIHLSKAAIGLASKDLSRADLTNVTITGSQLAVVVYQKTSEYGPAEMRLADLTLSDNERDYLLEERSTAYVDGKVMHGTAVDVAKVLYGVEYGRASN